MHPHSRRTHLPFSESHLTNQSGRAGGFIPFGPARLFGRIIRTVLKCELLLPLDRENAHWRSLPRVHGLNPLRPYHAAEWNGAELSHEIAGTIHECPIGNEIAVKVGDILEMELNHSILPYGIAANVNPDKTVALILESDLHFFRNGIPAFGIGFRAIRGFGPTGFGGFLGGHFFGPFPVPLWDLHPKYTPYSFESPIQSFI